jgi:hypothetical protein
MEISRPAEKEKRKWRPAAGFRLLSKKKEIAIKEGMLAGFVG